MNGLLLGTGELTAIAWKPEGLPRPMRDRVRRAMAGSLGHLEEHVEDIRLRFLKPARSRVERLASQARIEMLRARIRTIQARSPMAVVEEALLGVPEAFRDGVFAGALLMPNLIVDAGENFLVDAWQNLVELENMKFHGIGTGAVAAAEANTALGTELTTQYNPDNTRATGSLTEGASPNIFRTVGTNTVDATAAVTEWGLLSQAATGGGVLFSRVVFASISLASGDSLQTTWDLTCE
jgi:hypothetical protein